MRCQSLFRLFLLFALAAALLSAGCSALAADLSASTQPTAVNQPVEAVLPEGLAATNAAAQAPTPTMSVTEPPKVFTNPDVFEAALLQALMAKDTRALLNWMTPEFLTGGWRADGSYGAPVDALREVYADYLGTDNTLQVVKGADLKALLGGVDPLSFPREEAGVAEAVLISGWGKDGRDEAILYIARAADNSLMWHGWMVIQGGFSGARLGGIQLYSDTAHGYSMYLPKKYEVQETGAGTLLIMAPGAGHPGEQRAAAFIEIGPANGRSVEEITEQIKADLGPGFYIPTATAMGLDKAMALVLSGLPGQDANRQLFVVYNDLLYHITFVPDAPAVGAAYWQMEDLYAMIVNTFHFTN